MNEEKKHIMTRIAFLSLITLLIFSTGTLKAQPSVGFIQIHQDDAIQRLLNKHIQVNEYNPWINGYRVQLLVLLQLNPNQIHFMAFILDYHSCQCLDSITLVKKKMENG